MANEMAKGNLANKILALFFPPLSVLIKFGFGAKFLLNILLTLIGWLPGVIHAFWVLPKGNRVATT